MEQRQKFQNEHREDTAQEQSLGSQVEQQGGHAFDTPEELLRFDAAQNQLPTVVRERIETSIAEHRPLFSSAWWKRLFRKK